MGRLVDILAPSYSPEVHTIVAEFIKGIITIAAPSPGAGFSEGMQGLVPNKFARELAAKDSVTKLASFVLVDFTTPSDAADSPSSNHTETLDSPSSPREIFPNARSYLSSSINSLSVIVELIRKNNSDYFEPFLFHTLRNRLIQVQQNPATQDRESLERAMAEMVDRMGVVHLGPILEIFSERMGDIERYLARPRSWVCPAFFHARVLWLCSPSS